MDRCVAERIERERDRFPNRLWSSVDEEEAALDGDGRRVRREVDVGGTRGRGAESGRAEGVGMDR